VGAGPTRLAAEGRGRVCVPSDEGWPPRGVEMLPAPAGAAGECPPRPYPPEELLPGRGWELLGVDVGGGVADGLRPLLP
jgi:hypothetical protein